MQKLKHMFTIAWVAMGIMGSGVVVAQAQTLNISFGESVEGDGQETISGEVWNNSAGTDVQGSLLYADGSAATGVTVQMQGAGGAGNEVAASGYISAALDTVTRTLCWKLPGGAMTFTLSGLPADRVWEVKTYIGVSGSPMFQDVDVNGTTQSNLGLDSVCDTHEPVTFADITAPGGTITITTTSTPGNQTHVMEAITLVDVSPPPGTVFYIR